MLAIINCCAAPYVTHTEVVQSKYGFLWYSLSCCSRRLTGLRLQKSIFRAYIHKFQKNLLYCD